VAGKQSGLRDTLMTNPIAIVADACYSHAQPKAVCQDCPLVRFDGGDSTLPIEPTYSQAEALAG
jgi:hypothetical protein